MRLKIRSFTEIAPDPPWTLGKGRKREGGGRGRREEDGGRGRRQGGV